MGRQEEELAMHIQLHTRGVDGGEDFQDYVERRAHFALGRFAPRLRHVMVRVEDENGPRGGVDLRCRVELKLQAGDLVLAEDVDAQCRAAVDRALEKASRSLVRHLERVREDGR